jgi:YegS/Rv2252/BmrU family lipid kinase
MKLLRTAFIINPGAGGKRKDRLRKAAIARIAGMFPGAPLEVTGNPDEASRLARLHIEKGCECIAAMGGDGTLNSVLQGFFADDRGTPVRRGTALAVIPIGTGGDFRRTLGIEPDPLAALSLLTGTDTRPCDAGIVEYTDFEGKKRKKYFLNIASFGLSGLVDKYVQESSKKLGGTLTFFLSTVRAFKRYRNADVEIGIDDKEPRRLKSLLVAVANGRFFGSGMQIAPKADIGDGVFEIVILGDLHLKDFIRHGSKLYGGKMIGHPEVIYTSGRRITITPMDGKETMFMDMDGEPFGTIPASVEMIPSTLHIKI